MCTVCGSRKALGDGKHPWHPWHRRPWRAGHCSLALAQGTETRCCLYRYSIYLSTYMPTMTTRHVCTSLPTYYEDKSPGTTLAHITMLRRTAILHNTINWLNGQRILRGAGRMIHKPANLSFFVPSGRFEAKGSNCSNIKAVK